MTARTITGDLGMIGLPSLLQSIALHGGWGLLSVRRKDRHKTLFLDGHNLYLIDVSHPMATRVGQILLRSGRLLPDRLRQALESTSPDTARIGEILMAHGAITRGDLEQALTEQALEEIYDLFGWDDARFELREEKPPAVENARAVSITAVVLEAVRRVDEQRKARRIISSREMIPMRARLSLPEDDPSLDPHVVRHIGGLIDGRRTVADILRESPYPEFAVEVTLSGLIERGVLKLFERREERLRTVVIRRPVPPARGSTAVVISPFPSYGTALAASLNQAGIDASAHPSDGNIRRILETNRPNVMILDAVDALAELERVRPMARATGTDIVLLVNTPSRDAIVRAVRAGAREVLMKPISTATLVRRIKKASAPAA